MPFMLFKSGNERFVERLNDGSLPNSRGWNL